jgi:CDP-diacylglycerol--serine O-phosphatidyltransferase
MTTPEQVTGPARMFRASNLITYTSLLFGSAAAFSAVAFHNGSLAGAFLALAVISDTFDGRFARRFPHTPAQAAFGVQLDSLSDAINAGFVPVIVLGSLVIEAISWTSLAWWLVACVYILCAVTRLGYFNITHEQGPWFIGLPTPVASLIVSTSLIWQPGLLMSGLVLAGCAIAMVAPFRLPRPQLRGLLIFAAWALVLIAIHGARSASAPITETTTTHPNASNESE